MICNNIQKRADTSINICGMSERSQFMLNKYVFDQNILILAVQETGESSSFKKLTNFQMFEDPNSQKNKGCTLYLKTGVVFTPLPKISQVSSNIDTIWGLPFIKENVL